MKKRILSAVLAIVLLLSLTIPAIAATSTISNSSDSRISSMLSAIDNQNFNGSGTSAARAKTEIKYFLYDSTFAVFSGGHFNYPNSGSLAWTIEDGDRTLAIRGSTGCCAYSYYVSKTIYGREAETNKLSLSSNTAEALKTLLTENAQAGEHLRADNAPHSVAFISCDEKGFYCLSYCGDNNPVIHLDYWTYAAYISYYSGNKIYLYNANTAKNNVSTEDWSPVISLTDEASPSEIKYGSSFNLEGTVSTNVGVITKVRGFVTDYNGNIVMESSVNPNAKSFNINDGIDNKLSFGSLKVGSYTYYLYAEAANNKKTSSETLVERHFNVVSSGAALTVASTAKCGYQVTLPGGSASYASTLTGGSTAGTIKASSITSDCMYLMNDGTYRFSTEYNGKTVYVICKADTLRYNVVHTFAVAGRTEATCTRDGRISYQCACGQTKTETIPALGHNMQVSGMTAPSCTRDGEINYTCTVCGATRTDFTRTSGHFIGRDGYCVKCGEIPANPFQDVKEGSAYYNAVLWAYYANPQVVAGANKAGTLFNPTGSCTRAQVVTFLWRAAGSPEPMTTGNSYKDVSSSAYYYKAILWAAENGITSGYADGTFRPDQTVTRAQFVTFLWRFHGKEQPFSSLNPFVDVKESSNYYTAILWASETGVTSGYGNNDFRPDAVCNRWQVVTFIHRSMLVDM